MSTTGPAPGPLPGDGPPPGAGKPDLGAGFSWSWAKFQQHAGTLVLANLAVLGITVVILLPIYLSLAATVVLADPASQAAGIAISTGAVVGIAAVVGAAVLLLVVVSVALTGNLFAMTLTIADGGTPRFSDLFRAPRAGSTWRAALLLTVVTLVGLALCLLPGIVFAVGAAFTFLVLRDRGLGAAAAVRASFGVLRHNLGPGLLALLVAAAVAGLGGAVPLGALVANPIAMLLLTHQYRWMVGGRIAP